jgi:ketosteroid isomerase-like protein
MSSLINFAALGVLLALETASIAGAAQTDTEELIAVDKRQQHAFVTRDLDALRQIYTDDYVLVVASGKERTKAEVLAYVASSENHWDINETSGWAVKVHGDTAIVVATLHQKGTLHGKPFDSNVKFSDTYVRENGKWRNVHGHASQAVDVQPPA